MPAHTGQPGLRAVKRLCMLFVYSGRLCMNYVSLWHWANSRVSTVVVCFSLTETLATPLDLAAASDRQTRTRDNRGAGSASSPQTYAPEPTTGRRINQRGSREAAATRLEVTTTQRRRKIKRFVVARPPPLSELNWINTISSSPAIVASTTRRDAVGLTQFRREVFVDVVRVRPCPKCNSPTTPRRLPQSRGGSITSRTGGSRTVTR